MLEVPLEELIWCSSSGSPRSARKTAGLGPPPGWSSPPPPPRWCHTVRSGGGARVVRPCRHTLWPETGGTPPSPKAADGRGACPCWSPWWTVAQMWWGRAGEDEALDNNCCAIEILAYLICSQQIWVRMWKKKKLPKMRQYSISERAV